MALHLNLYHEIHKEAARERRDPFKLAILGGVVLLIALVFWYFYRLSTVTYLETQRSRLKGTWVKLEPQLKAAVENEPKFMATQASNQALINRLQNRFYWGSFLNQLAGIVPPQVQIVTLSGEVATDKEKDKKKTLKVLLRGVAAGVQPRTVADEFLRSLREKLSKSYSEVTADFDANSLESGLDTVQLGGETLGTATFRITIQFKPAMPPAPEATPQPKEAK